MARRQLYCCGEYPTPLDNLLAGVKFEHLQGFSDHTVGLDAAKIALARGAKIIEKHFALSHDSETDGPDAGWSMVPSELEELVRWQKVCKEVL